MLADKPKRVNMENGLFNYLSLTSEEKTLIDELNIIKCYNKGTILLREGDNVDKCYFVIKGCIRTYYLNNGDEITAEFYTESNPLSPFCLRNKKPSSFNVACVEESLLCVTTPKVEAIIFRKFPHFESLYRMLVEEVLVNTHISFAQFKNASPEQRYENMIVNRPDLVKRAPLSQIASYLGIKPESLSRLRKRVNNKLQMV